MKILPKLMAQLGYRELISLFHVQCPVGTTLLLFLLLTFELWVKPKAKICLWKSVCPRLQKCLSWQSQLHCHDALANTQSVLPDEKSSLRFVIPSDVIFEQNKSLIYYSFAALTFKLIALWNSLHFNPEWSFLSYELSNYWAEGNEWYEAWNST